MAADLQPLAIDVVSDVVCPWCYLGGRRLALALERAGGAFDVRWRPFQLDPNIPAGGLERRAYLKAKFRDDARLQQIHDQLTALGAEVGVAYAFDKIERAPNTLDAHRLIRWAAEANVQDKAVDRLFRLYFEEGGDVGDRAMLAEVAQACGLDGAQIERRLAGDDDVEAVREDIEEAHRLGVTGVPFFILGARFAVAGAQSVDVLVAAIERTRAALAGVEIA
jgi:predicted DsbA family dithiol-disulfide isomerase